MQLCTDSKISERLRNVVKKEKSSGYRRKVSERKHVWGSLDEEFFASLWLLLPKRLLRCKTRSNCLRLLPVLKIKLLNSWESYRDGNYTEQCPAFGGKSRKAHGKWKTLSECSFNSDHHCRGEAGHWASVTMPSFWIITAHQQRWEISAWKPCLADGFIMCSLPSR